ncbi:LptA/OstA family protein [Rhodospirillum sp. A1_3_36]|uniref:LptA/OstA family protein n=1 Tax=Rhodospirillum sp. A1_3_36 TaxID=3391666 RepID=UPI0039A5632F
MIKRETGLGQGRLGRGVWGIGVLLLASVVGLAGSAMGQTAGGEPLEVFADDGIEWRRDEGLYIANGNAAAIQGTSEVYADRLIARYRPTESDDGTSSGSDVYRMEALGHVRILMPDQTITGDKAVRDMERHVMWLTGDNLRMETTTDIVTARDSLEYWEARDLAVARGNAVSTQKESGQTISADILTAYFKDETEDPPVPNASSSSKKGGAGVSMAAPGGGQSRVKVMTAVGNVVVVTNEDVIRGDEATYDPATGEATILGDVTITTADQQMSGNRATVNMRTGVSRLFSDGKGRTRALFNSSEGIGSGSSGLLGGGTQEKKQ